MIQRYTRIGNSRGSLGVEESDHRCWRPKRRCPMGVAYEANSPRSGGHSRRAGSVAVYPPCAGLNRLADHDRIRALQGLAAVRRNSNRSLHNREFAVSFRCVFIYASSPSLSPSRMTGFRGSRRGLLLRPSSPHIENTQSLRPRTYRAADIELGRLSGRPGFALSPYDQI